MTHDPYEHYPQNRPMPHPGSPAQADDAPVSRELFDFVCSQRDEYAEKLEAEKLDRLQSTQSLYAEQLRMSALIDELLTERADTNRKYLELCALITYYTEDNKGYPYVRDSRGEVAKAAIDAFNALNTPMTTHPTHTHPKGGAR
jgi:hypothetical protein